MVGRQTETQGPCPEGTVSAPQLYADKATGKRKLDPNTERGGSGVKQDTRENTGRYWVIFRLEHYRREPSFAAKACRAALDGESPRPPSSGFSEA